MAQIVSLIDEHNEANTAVSATPAEADEFSLDNVPMGTFADLQAISEMHP